MEKGGERGKRGLGTEIPIGSSIEPTHGHAIDLQVVMRPPPLSSIAPQLRLSLLLMKLAFFHVTAL